jgi:hypothetical protein
MKRTKHTTVRFTAPFSLSGVDEIQPPGDYAIAEDEELIDGISWLAYRRVVPKWKPSSDTGAMESSGSMSSASPSTRAVRQLSAGLTWGEGRGWRRNRGLIPCKGPMRPLAARDEQAQWPHLSGTGGKGQARLPDAGSQGWSAVRVCSWSIRAWTPDPQAKNARKEVRELIRAAKKLAALF